MKNLSHQHVEVNRLPACIGNYSPSCAQDCPQAVAWECLEASRLAQEQEANRLRRRQARMVPPERHHLLRLGYAPGCLSD